MITNLIQFVLQIFFIYASVILGPAFILHWLNKNWFFGRAVLVSIFLLFLPALILINNYFDLRQFLDIYSLWGLPDLELYSSLVLAFTLGSTAASWAVAFFLFQRKSQGSGPSILLFVVLTFLLNVIAKVVVQRIIYAGQIGSIPAQDLIFLLVCLLTESFAFAYVCFSDKCRRTFFY